jgi:hypothetical protein
MTAARTYLDFLDDKERWDIVSGYLASDEESIKWANAWPVEKLVKWGKTS